MIVVIWIGAFQDSSVRTESWNLSSLTAEGRLGWNIDWTLTPWLETSGCWYWSEDFTHEDSKTPNPPHRHPQSPRWIRSLKRKNNRHGWASPVSIETAASQLRPHWVINSGTEVMEGCLREPETDEVCVEPSRWWQIFAGSAVQHRSRNQTRARETEIRLQEELVLFVDINDCSAAQKSAAR